jgi:squalene cyclase
MAASPPFAKGWGALPFDRSSPDLTAHTLRAWRAWRQEMPAAIQSRIDRGTEHGIAFLLREQRGDGSWRPLWFGNQHRRDDEDNPTYGTAKVLLALGEIDPTSEVVTRARPGCFPIKTKTADGVPHKASRPPRSRKRPSPSAP